MQEFVLPEETKDELLIALWDKLVEPGLNSFNAAKIHVESLKPPTPQELIDLIDSTDVPSVIEKREALEAAEELVETLTDELESWAKETLSVAATPDERVIASQALNREKSKLKANLEAMLQQAENFGLTADIEWINELIKYVSPPSTSRPVSSSTTEEREWLRSPEGGSHKLSDRGRIPAALHTLWLNRNV